jgi:O-acetylhomoserine (thiol)-lyase
MTTDGRKLHLETLALHAGYTPDETTSRGVPLHRTSSYVFHSTEHAANLFGLKELGNIYTRVMNPTNGVLEERVAALYGAPASLAMASGTAAVHYSIANICQAGDHIVSANDLYGGTYTMFDCIHPQFGIETTFVDPSNSDNIAKAITPKTRAIFLETCANPELKVPDFDAVAAIAKEHHLPIVCDNTFATPVLFNPIEHGVNVVADSLTKWMGGHGIGIGGVMTDGANFDWTDKKFPLFNEPDPSYHGVRYAHDLGDLNPICFAMRMRLVPLRNLGACLAPDNAWMFLQGLETLPLRMARHCENAMAVAKHLRDCKEVEWVKYPGFEDHPTHANAKKYLKGGFGGMVVFGIKGGEAAGRKFIESLEIFSHLANVGDAKSLAIHSWSTTHSQLSDEQKRAGGITPELVRLSVGIEHIDDIRADIDQALAKATK